jgi:hypothetical protein
MHLPGPAHPQVKACTLPACASTTVHLLVLTVPCYHTCNLWHVCSCAPLSTQQQRLLRCVSTNPAAGVPAGVCNVRVRHTVPCQQLACKLKNPQAWVLAPLAVCPSSWNHTQQAGLCRPWLVKGVNKRAVMTDTFWRGLSRARQCWNIRQLSSHKCVTLVGTYCGQRPSLSAHMSGCQGRLHNDATLHATQYVTYWHPWLQCTDLGQVACDARAPSALQERRPCCRRGQHAQHNDQLQDQTNLACWCGTAPDQG